MDEFSFRGSHVPAFGSWDYSNDLPFTQCFESARQAGLHHRYSYSEDRDSYVSGDLYRNDVVTPAMMAVPRRRAKTRYPQVKEAKREGWVVGDEKEPPSPVSSPPPPLPRKASSRAVDEDLYKISPEIFYAKLRRKRGRGFFSSCLLPACASW